MLQKEREAKERYIAKHYSGALAKKFGRLAARDIETADHCFGMLEERASRKRDLKGPQADIKKRERELRLLQQRSELMGREMNKLSGDINRLLVHDGVKTRDEKFCSRSAALIHKLGSTDKLAVIT